MTRFACVLLVVLAAVAPASAHSSRAGCVVPNVRGRTLPAAKQALGRAGCRVGGVTRVYSGSVRVGRVVSESPPAGRRLRSGTRVSLRVSKGKRPAPLPTKTFRVDVGGYRLYMHCTGTGSPTVVLEAGLTRNHGDWSAVEPTAARTTRVCAYDRAGRGESDTRPPGPFPAERVTDELHALLAGSGIPGPYVLGAHSLGGFFARLYAARYPADVAGIVLADGAPESWLAANWDAVRTSIGDEGGLQVATGISTLSGFSTGAKPLVVLEQGLGQLPANLPYGGWEDGQKSIARRSTNAWLVKVRGVGHSIPFAPPAGNAPIVVAALQQVVAAVRGGAPLGPCTAGPLVARGGDCVDPTG